GSAASASGACQLLPAIVDTDPDAHAGGAEADAAARAVIPVAIAAALDVAFPRRITIGIANDHAAAAAGSVTPAVFVADQANLLHQIRRPVFSAGDDIRGLRGAAGRQRADAGEQCDCKCPHSVLLVHLPGGQSGQPVFVPGFLIGILDDFALR